MKAHISVIIPIFNADKYLREALDCLKKQTMIDIEFICVDDASTDRSIEILREFQRADSRFLVFQNDVRKGAAFSRNSGIDAAHGEYICFFDADDIFDHDILQNMYDAIDGKNADVAICEFMHSDSAHIFDYKEKFRSERFIKKFCEKVFDVTNCSFKDIFDILTPQPWNKMYRRDFMLKHHLQFQDLENSNDVYFVTMAMGLADRLIMVNERRVLYHARNHGSATRISSHRKAICAYHAAEKIISDLNEGNIPRKRLNYFFLCAFITILSGFNKTLSPEEAKEYYDFLNQSGIEMFLKKAEKNTPFVDPDIINKLSGFMKYTYEENKTYKSYVLELCLEKEQDRISSILIQARENAQKIGLWGIGYNGKVFWDFIERLGYEIDYPGDQTNAGKEYKGVRICDIDEMTNRSDIIFISTDQIPQSEILKYIDVKKKKVYGITGEGLL